MRITVFIISFFSFLLLLSPAIAEEVLPKEILYQDVSIANGAVYMVKSTNKRGLYFWYMGGQKCRATVVSKIISVKCPSEEFTTEPDSGDVVIKYGGVVANTATEGTLLHAMYYLTMKHARRK